jgi:hypothetical protein
MDTIQELVNIFETSVHNSPILKATRKITDAVNRDPSNPEHTTSIISTGHGKRLGNRAIDTWKQAFAGLVERPYDNQDNLLVVEGHLVDQKPGIGAIRRIWNPDSGYQPVISVTGLPFKNARDPRYSVDERNGFGSAYFAIDFGLEGEDWTRAMRILKEDPSLANDVLARLSNFRTQLGTGVNFYDGYVLHGESAPDLETALARANGKSIREAGLPYFEVDFYLTKKDGIRSKLASTRS